MARRQPRGREPLNSMARTIIERAARFRDTNWVLRLAVEVLVAKSITTWNSAGDYYDRMQDSRIHDVASRVLRIEAV